MASGTATLGPAASHVERDARPLAPSTERLVLTVLCGLLLMSGAAGLIYQVVWVRLLSLSFGVTVFAVSTVLAAFMGGLAIGSVVGGRYADRLRRPLAAYGVVELGIAATALATPTLFLWLQGLYRELALVLDPATAPILAGAVRGLLAFTMLLIPTALMGASLPLAVRGVRRSARTGEEGDSAADVRRDSRAMGLLYALNTTGAILGCLAAGFMLIGSYGINQTVAFAALLNGIAGVSALALAFATQQSSDSTVSATPEAIAPDRELIVSPQLARAAFIAFGLSGAVSLAYEVVWSRVLAILFDSTIYGFVLMLATVLFGIAVGSAVCGVLVTRFPKPRLAGVAFGWVEAAMGVAAVLSLATFGVSYDLLRQFGETGLGQRLVRTDTRVMATLCVLTVLPVSLLMGATFPLAARLWAAGAGKLGARLGGVYAANVAGAIVGSLAGGFILVPLFGAHTSILILASCNVAIGVWLLWVAGGRTMPVVAAVSVGLLIWGAMQAPLHSQVFRQRYPDQEMLWFHEGLENTVTIARGPEGIRTLFTNSRGQSNDQHDLVSFYRTIGHVAALLAPEAPRAMVVGIGSGVTSGTIAQHPGSTVRIVELSDGMAAAAPHFAPTNRDLVNLPNVRITMDDGRNFLLRERGTFDLIASDVIHPYDAGSNNLYSVEYFRMVARALSQNGIVLQWVTPAPEFEHKLIIRTFKEAFPHVALWGNGDILIGSVNPLTMDEESVSRRMRDPAISDSLRELNINGVQDVLGRFRLFDDEVAEYAGPGPVLSDERPIFEYFSAHRRAPGDLSQAVGGEGVVEPPQE